jgi:RHH-type proline utilization regulon transcriptional repressor/proline dehydrogenase/delta 1-pyrroline-5-carboxylate dehydrogenase
MDDFYALKFLDENEAVKELLNDLETAQCNKSQTAQQAHVFVETIRAKKNETSGFNALMQSYDLTSEEGLALMTLAEALLRIPDTNTANDLIQDKLSDGDWSHLFDNADGFLGKFSGYGLSFSQKIIDSMIGKMGMPLIRKACVEAMKLMGKTFVLGRDIEEAIDETKTGLTRGYTYNFDMLGEGARTSADAQYYFDAYAHAIRTIGQSTNSTQDIFKRPGISVKLSALYPRYEFTKREKCVPFLTAKLQELCIIAAEYNINLTIDAEECDRFTTSLSIIKNIIEHPVLKTWDGFGFAVQAYHKRASAVIDKAITWAKSIDQKISIRLVKGAYWDSEIKYAQVEGHIGYPVFTRKENTDLSYLACAHKLLNNRDVIVPMFGTHNAQTVASILDMAGDDQTGFIFQRLHGMGEQLHDQILSNDIPSCIYAPVGTHKYLLAYLVRRLLENGANSSFVNKIYDDETSIDDLTQHPIDLVMANKGHHTHPQIPLPSGIYKNRQNSAGLDIFEDTPLKSLFETIKNYEDTKIDAPCIINGNDVDDGHRVQNTNPSNRHDIIGSTYYATDDTIALAYDHLSNGLEQWRTSDVETRATALEKIADLYEENTSELMAILIREAGKTIPDAIAEIREAVDFCRYYAIQAHKDFALKELDGPTGETNTLQLEGRGIFTCISPWNFPLAIFTGQIVAALVAGNAVMIKPAEQTPAIATYAVRLMLAAGIPENVIALIQGDG